MRRFRFPILVLSLCLGLGGLGIGLWAYAADPTGSNTNPPANTTTGTCTGAGCGTNTSGTTTGTCTGANCGTNTNVATTTFVGAGNVVASANAWWGLRAYTTAIAAAGTQPLVNLRRASDNHTCDILVANNGGFGNTSNCSTGGDNGQTASAFCNATTCSIPKVYDQTGNGNHLTQATAANQPTITFNCFGTLPCMTIAVASSQSLAAAATPSQNGPLTIGAVAQANTSAVQMSLYIDGGPQQIGYRNSAANQIFMFQGTVVPVTASDNAQHSIIGVLNDGSSTMYVDNISTPGSTGAGTGGVGVTVGGNSFDGKIEEIGRWPIGFSVAQAASLCSNQQAFLTSSNFGAAC